MAFLNLKSSEKPDGTPIYESLQVDHHGKLIMFDTGDLCLDHKNMFDWMCENETNMLFSSDYDHFLMDTDEYRARIIAPNADGEYVFIEEYGVEGSLEVVAKNDHKTFKELKEYVKHKKSSL